MSLPESPIPQLTDSEWACLREAMQLHHSDEIAARTGFKPGTVDAYLSRASRKLGANNRRHAIQIVRRDYPDLFNQSEFVFAPLSTSFQTRLTGLLSRLPWPWPTRRSPTNDRSLIQKAVMLAIAVAILAAGAAIYLSSLAALNRKM